MADEEANMEEVPVEAEAETEEKPVSTDGKVAEGTTVAGVTLDGTQFPLSLVLISSIILLIATTASPDKWKYTKTYQNYAISISSISLIISFLSLLMYKFAGGLYAKVGEYLCVTNFTWCFIGACFLTFKGPFLTTSNGYFAAWASVYGCAMAMGMDSNAFKSNIKGLGAVMGHLAASIVLLVASIPEIDSKAKGSRTRNNAIYALSLCCLSIVVALMLMSMDKKGKQLGGMANLGLFASLSIFWLVSACLVTFRGPFDETGNGYFAAWAGFITAGYATMAAYKNK